jgi:hypothetical protein
VTSRRSPFRLAAEREIRAALAAAEVRRTPLRALQRELRRRFAVLLATTVHAVPKAARGVWYAAIRSATGVGVLTLPDFAQVAMGGVDVKRGRKKRRTRGGSQ